MSRSREILLLQTFYRKPVKVALSSEFIQTEFTGQKYADNAKREKCGETYLRFREIRVSLKRLSI